MQIATTMLEGAMSLDSAPFESLVAAHERRVLRLAQRLLLNSDAARDAAQEVFLRLHKHYRELSGDIGPWLYRTTANVCFDMQRRTKYHAELEEIAEEAGDPATRMHRRNLVYEALSTLSTREREAIVLRDLEGYTSSEVAGILGTTETTVRSQISTGRVKMRRFLAGKI